MVQHLAGTHTAALAQLCSACWDPKQACSQINLMQLVGCYERANRRKASHFYFEAHISVQNFNKHPLSKNNCSLNPQINYSLRKATHEWSFLVKRQR